jgi:pyridinium-3,5-bisthiocarboxylic acid mononucleotide nickel chelatase
MAHSLLPPHTRGVLHHRHEDHDEGHQLRPSLTPRGALPAGAGVGKIVYFDAQSGIAGDMTIASLLDLGVPSGVIREAVDALGLPGVDIEVEKVQVGPLGATRFDVHVHGEQPERSYAEIRELLRTADLDPSTRKKAECIFARLARAEAQVHDTDIEHVHFHEVGAVDAIVDIVGASAALSYLGGRVLCSPLPLGHGTVECRHGILPVPAPATLLCLQGMLTVDGGLAMELTTPTGAAIVGALAQSSPTWPASRPLAVGWGAGHRELPDRPNALRVVLADAVAAEVQTESHEIISCNVDDMNGEELGHAIARLLRAGALDAWAAPIVMKKGRPAWTLSALTTRLDAASVVDALFSDSSTIGLRRHLVSRVELPRRIGVVQTRFGEVPVKVSGEGSGRHVKPEFDACADLADAHGVPVRDVLNAALIAALEQD